MISRPSMSTVTPLVINVAACAMSTASTAMVTTGDGGYEIGRLPQSLPSGKHTKSAWKLSFIVSFPIKHGDFP